MVLLHADVTKLGLKCEVLQSLIIRAAREFIRQFELGVHNVCGVALYIFNFVYLLLLVSMFLSYWVRKLSSV